MSQHITRRLPAVLLLFFTFSTIPALADSQAGTNPDPERILTPDAYLRLQAEQYTADFSVSVEEATRRLRLQPLISELQADLAMNDSDVFAELRAENGPSFRVIVQVTAGGEQRVRSYIKGSALEDLVQIETVKWTLTELRSHQAQATAIAGRLGIDMDSSIRDQHVIMYVTDAAAVDIALRGAGAQLPETVLVKQAPGLAQPTSHLNGDLLAGIAFEPDGGCTIGFAGWRKSDGTKGIFTAGHCSNSQSYGHALTPTVDFSWAESDIQFHGNSSGEPLRNLVWIGNNTWVPVTSLYWRSWIYTGQQVCKMGKVNGYKCGVVDSTTYDPGGAGTYEGIQRSPVFIMVKDDQQMVLLGDSGGPWIGATGNQHNAAFGITSGNTDPHDGYYWAFFTSIDPIFNSFEIFTSCTNYIC